ncbi:MAG TPA: hypothetical protein VFI46_17885 [Jiangellaceae bacterium]|nr:hypothetical protein [Jiangellaceae bacterium]
MPIAAFPRRGGVSTVDGVTALLLLLTVAAVLGVGYVLVARSRPLLGAVLDVGRQVEADRAAHDHHVNVLDKRMRAVEASAASAERESHMVTLHMADLNRVMLQQAEILTAIRDDLNVQRDGTDNQRPLRSPVPRLPDRGGRR